MDNLPMYLKCNNCGFEETDQEEFIGIFPVGQVLKNTNGEACGIFACPKCSTVRYVDSDLYLNRRKQEYKEKMKQK